MAWLEQDPRSKHFKVCFRWGGSRVKRSLKTSNQDQAQDIAKTVEACLIRLERGWAELPAGSDVVTFALSNGKLNGKPSAPKTVGLGEMFDRYRASLPAGALEVNSLATVRIHMKHFERVLGVRFSVENLTHDRLQDYDNKRTREKTKRVKLLSPITVRKELTTLSGVWSWALARDLVHGAFPSTGLKFPKISERAPFQTWAEIERQIKHGAGEELWECFFLTLQEIGEVLDYVTRSARHSFIYPMFLFMALRMVDTN